jgi:hypothetical protein
MWALSRLFRLVRPQSLIPKRGDKSAHKINKLVDRFDPTDGYHPSEQDDVGLNREWIPNCVKNPPLSPGSVRIAVGLRERNGPIDIAIVEIDLGKTLRAGLF